MRGINNLCFIENSITGISKSKVPLNKNLLLISSKGKLAIKINFIYSIFKDKWYHN